VNRREFLSAFGLTAAGSKLSWASEQSVLSVRDPYLQNVRLDRATVMWATQNSGTGYVEYSLDGINYRRASAQSRVFSPAETGLQASYTQYTAVVSRLAPNTQYFYRAIVNNEVVGVASRFRTAAPASEAFRFLVTSDSGMGTPEQLRVAGVMAQEDASFILHLGDLAYFHGSFGEFQRNHFDVYRQTMARLPFFPSPGNHEYESANAAPYIGLHSVPVETVPFAERGYYYSFDWGNVHFVSLDSNSDTRSNGALRRAMDGTGEMLTWLERDLRSTRQFWRVVFFHHAAFAGGANASDPIERDVRTYLVPILEANGVQLVLNGHEHSYQRTFPLKGERTVANGTGTVYVTAGGGGATLYDVPSLLPQTAIQRIQHHVVRIDVAGAQLALTAIDDFGRPFDGLTLSPLPVFADPSRAVTFSAEVAGALIYIRGWNLALRENPLQPVPVASLGGTSLTVNDQLIPLIYVSPTQVVGQLPFDFPRPALCRIFTPNGSADYFIGN
jgi:acid phosphatase type 7